MPFVTTVWDHTYATGMKGQAGCPAVLRPTPSPARVAVQQRNKGGS